MIEHIAQYVAEHIKRVVPEHPASIARLKHALAILINMVGIIVIALICSLLIGTFWNTVIILCVFAVLRQITGGYHLKSGIACMIVSSSLFVLLALITISSNMVLLLNSVSIVLVIAFAPSNIKNHSRIPEKWYPFLKLLGMLFISLNFWFGSSSFALAAFVQCLLLINFKPLLRNIEAITKIR
ncbi:accessory gene regulator ArgB-like protein [Paenibacillus campi]|uniref:accessory gene regulator ArgB-like protein n=1 Tax=Paenibacillus campi TaxID=3106031 RepID=UPI002AFE9480|nr:MULTISPECIES: accessory gene regulator B family protein [unclassified Paenibacillus]